MIFNTTIDSVLYYLWEYVPRNRYFMDYSSNITLKFKNGHMPIIKTVADVIMSFLGDKFAITTIPGSS